MQKCIHIYTPHTSTCERNEKQILAKGSAGERCCVFYKMCKSTHVVVTKCLDLKLQLILSRFWRCQSVGYQSQGCSPYGFQWRRSPWFSPSLSSCHSLAWTLSCVLRASKRHGERIGTSSMHSLRGHQSYWIRALALWPQLALITYVINPNTVKGYLDFSKGEFRGTYAFSL